jgi:hypothetical protein
MLRDLVGLGIAVEHVDETIHMVARHLGVNVRGSVSERTVSRATLEGGIGVPIQLAEEIRHSDSKSKLLTHLITSLMFTPMCYNQR